MWQRDAEGQQAAPVLRSPSVSAGIVLLSCPLCSLCDPHVSCGGGWWESLKLEASKLGSLTSHTATSQPLLPPFLPAAAWWWPTFLPSLPCRADPCYVLSEGGLFGNRAFQGLLLHAVAGSAVSAAELTGRAPSRGLRRGAPGRGL